MALPDIKSMMTELSDGKSGENCEYDSLYMELDELAVPVADQEMGDSVTEGRDADFRKLQKCCEELWGKTRDLRVAAYLTIASFCNNGLKGLEQGLELIDYLLENMWDEVWPQLDPDDDNDPTERINSLSMLSPKTGAFSDPIQFMNHFRQVKLCDGLPYSLRDYLILQGTLDGGENYDVDPVLMQGQLRNAPYESMLSAQNATNHVIELVNKITAEFNDKAGQNGYLTMDSLLAELKHLKRFYDSYVQAPSNDENDEPQEEEQSINEGAENATVPVAARPQSAPSVRATDVRSLIISNRIDALLLIRKCSDYFAKTEPTSPLPYLLKRALRMADMNFVDILAEIDQNSLEKVKEQLGVLPSADE